MPKQSIKIQLNCEACGNNFLVYPSNVRLAESRGQRLRFCSRGCYSSSVHPSIEERFLANRSEPDENGCCIWRGVLASTGYGRMFHRREIAAHRYAWERSNGPIPLGLFVCHTCDVRACVNINHLFLGTIIDNGADMVAKGRHVQGETDGNSKLTEKSIREIRCRHAAGGVSYASLAREFGVAKPTVRCIVLRRTWKHVGD